MYVREDMPDLGDRDEDACKACGGSGGGPFGRAGSAWDDDAYVCPRCEGAGIAVEAAPARGPGIVKAEPAEPADEVRRKAQEG